MRLSAINIRTVKRTTAKKEEKKRPVLKLFICCDKIVLWLWKATK